MVGGREASLSLAIGLQRSGYAVTLLISSEWKRIGHGPVVTSGYLLQDALNIERELGLNFWDTRAPRVTTLDFGLYDQSDAMTERWLGRFEHVVQCVDHRLRCPHALRVFENFGGSITFGDLTVDSVEELAASNDLVIVGTGRRDIAGIFPLAPGGYEVFTPRRRIRIVHIRRPVRDREQGRIVIRVVPGIGEFARLPALGVDGTYEVLMLQGKPGAGLDSTCEVRTASAQLALIADLVNRFWPEEVALWREASTTSERDFLTEEFKPVQRSAVGVLPSGRAVLGMGDVISVNEPIVGQGSNAAYKAARLYVDEIRAVGDGDFHPEWMADLGKKYWDAHARWSTALTNELLSGGDVVRRASSAATQNSEIADAFCEGMNDPGTLWPWFYEETAFDDFVRDIVDRSRRPVPDRTDLRRIFANFATGVVVVTTFDGQRNPTGLTVNSFTSVSLDPPLILWCCDRTSKNAHNFQVGTVFYVNILGENQEYLSRIFATRGLDKFSDIAWREGDRGVPIIEDTVAGLCCETESLIPAGDHFIVLGRILETEERGGAPLVYHSGSYQIVTKAYA